MQRLLIVRKHETSNKQKVQIKSGSPSLSKQVDAVSATFIAAMARGLAAMVSRR
jgi:hypothetical protein